jgi:peptidoglycan/xylan/chitin deacetylase (PgdA/CDA1 family)
MPGASGRLKRELPRTTPRFLERIYPGVLWYGDPTLPHVALSYDDGPDPRDTPRVLNVLAQHNVVATFSWLGERASAHPDLVSQVARAGHHIMLHGQRHRSFLLEQPRLLRQSLHQARVTIADAAEWPPDRIVHVRPPYGHISPRIVRALRRWGYRPVMGSLVPAHWLQPASFTIRQVGAHVQNGSLIVLHESLGGPPVDLLTDEILKRLVNRGLTLITIEQMWAEHQWLHRPVPVSR